jgi:two-component system chemotaxis sensor kinase CheA
MWSKGLATSDTIYRNYLYTPVENLLTPYQELLQKLSDSQQKQILPLKIQTNNVAVAEEIYSSLFASLVHIFRNLIDHGIEFPEERTLSQKPAEGKIEVTVALKTVALKAITQSELLVIDISDDGRGINPEKIRSKMTSLGVDTSTENDEQVIQHVFDAQVSTKETVTELSGRGVGLDAVKVEVTRLGGRIWVTSQLGQGTTFRIEVPWKAQIHKASLQAA